LFLYKMDEEWTLLEDEDCSYSLCLFGRIR
jgi:hypothetical protein